MMKYFDKKILFLLLILIGGCSTNKYFSDNDFNYSFEGEWIFNNDSNRKLIISQTEDDLYSLKLFSDLGDWEGIGCKIDDELLAIFKYKKLNQKGYVTFKFLGNVKIYFESLNTNGEFRSSGNYYKIKSQ